MFGQPKQLASGIAKTLLRSSTRKEVSPSVWVIARAASSSSLPLTRRLTNRPIHPIHPPLHHSSQILSRRSQSTSSSSTRPCPSCSAPLLHSTSPCPKCSTLIPLPSDLSYHSLLSLCSPIPSSSSTRPFDISAELSGLPSRGYDLQPRDLRNRMLTRQRDLHPDKFGSSGERMVSLAKELSGRVNRAYEILADPLKRAEYILSVHDVHMEESDTLTDPMLLMEIMEAREELEEASTIDEVQGIREANQEKVESTISALRSSFAANPPDFQHAKNLAVQLRYWMTLEAAAKEWTPETGAGGSAGSGFSHS